MVNARDGWKLVTFDPESYFVFFSSVISLQWLDLATSFSVRGYIFRMSRSGSMQSQGHGFKFRVTAARKQLFVPSEAV